MKKINILAVVIFLSSAFSVFGNVPALNNRTDSLNYVLGLLNGSNVKMYYLQNNATEASVQSIMDGMEDAMKNNSEYRELEILAANMGNAMKQQNEDGFLGIEGETVNMEMLKQGLINGMKGHDTQMTSQEANMYIQVVMQRIQDAEAEKLYEGNKKAGEEFLAENAKKAGVVTLPSGLQYKIIKEGKGEKPTAMDRVKVHYNGTLIDGTVFDSSIGGDPITFGVTQVIKGWTEALQLMPVGSKWTLYIPQELAYGSQGAGTIEPYSTLIFEVELLGIEK